MTTEVLSSGEATMLISVPSLSLLKCSRFLDGLGAVGLRVGATGGRNLRGEEAVLAKGGAIWALMVLVSEDGGSRRWKKDRLFGIAEEDTLEGVRNKSCRTDSAEEGSRIEVGTFCWPETEAASPR